MAQKLFKHVLPADDDLDECEFFSDVFKTNFPDVKLTFSNNGNRLMNLLEGPPDPKADLIFSDLNMPVLLGQECFEKMRSSLEPSNGIIVIFSTGGSPSEIEKMYSAGANYLITKTATYKDLSKLISKAVSLSSQTDIRQPSFENFYINI